MRFLVGLIGMPLGFVIVYYRERIQNFTGNFDWAEKHLGSGGTFTAIMLFGLAVAIGSLLYMFGTLQAFLSGIRSIIFPG